MEDTLLFYKITDNAYTPSKGSLNAAGYDLRASSDCIIKPIPFKNLPVPTDIAVVVPNGYYGRIAPRSGLALKLIDVGAGVIDSDYRGEIKLIMYNYGDEDFIVKKGDRIAQLICEKILTTDIEEIYNLKDYPSNRGKSGMGSTGIN